jgi:integrase
MANSITNLGIYQVDRSKYEFKTEGTLIHDEYGELRMVFCSVLVEARTSEIVAFTGLEKYVVDPNRVTVLAESTIRVAMSRVNSFLNYLLHDTKINSLNDVSVNELRHFLIASRYKTDNEEMKSDSWERKHESVFRFLLNYYKYNHGKQVFKYTKDDLEEVFIANNNTEGISGKKVVSKIKDLNVKAPKENDFKHRNRAIMYGHLDTLLFTAKKYDPELYLAIATLDSSGIRIGGVVNLSFSDIYAPTRIGVNEKVIITLVESDRYRKGKAHKGAIKKRRPQEVFPDFCDKFRKALEFHKDYLQAHGYPTSGNNPLFYNNYGTPISATSLSDRIRDLFNNHFLRLLKESSENTPFEGETQAFIESYEKEYPGAHMFRHWFTMYLLTKARLTSGEIMRWRGDANQESMNTYIHENADLIQLFRDSSYTFQRQILEEIIL